MNLKAELIALRKQISKTVFQLAEQKTESGEILVSKEDQIIEGIELQVYDADGKLIPAPDSTYVMDNGDTVEVSGGIVTKITPKEAPQEQPSQEEVIESAPEVKSEESVLAVVDELISKLMELGDRLSSIETKMSTTDELVTKMSKHIPVDEIKTEIELSKNKSKLELGADKALNYFKK